MLSANFFFTSFAASPEIQMLPASASCCRRATMLIPSMPTRDFRDHFAEVDPGAKSRRGDLWARCVSLRPWRRLRLLERRRGMSAICACLPYSGPIGNARVVASASFNVRPVWSTRVTSLSGDHGRIPDLKMLGELALSLAKINSSNGYRRAIAGAASPMGRDRRFLSRAGPLRRARRGRRGGLPARRSAVSRLRRPRGTSTGSAQFGSRPCYPSSRPKGDRTSTPSWSTPRSRARRRRLSPAPSSCAREPLGVHPAWASSRVHGVAGLIVLASPKRLAIRDLVDQPRDRRLSIQSAALIARDGCRESVACRRVSPSALDESWRAG